MQITNIYKYFPNFERLQINAEIPHFFSNEKTSLTFIKKEDNTKGTKTKLNLTLDIKNVATIDINDISDIISTTFSRNLSIIVNKKEYKLIFRSLMDKYLFTSMIYNYHLASLSREFFAQQLHLNVSVLTWNLSSIDLPDLSSLFRTGSLKKVDILAMGVQECNWNKKKNWANSLRVLAKHYGMEEVAYADVLQMFIIVFIKKELKPMVTNVETETKGMGAMGFVGNKGCELISFRVMGYLFVFVNCHLAPKVFKILERNKMAQQFVSCIKIDEKFATFDVLADYIFWFGDMNYRVDYEFHETIDFLDKGNLKGLRDKDQLRKQMSTNKIFSTFNEKQIDFLPTYRRKKFVVDEDGHKTLKNEKEDEDESNTISTAVQSNIPSQITNGAPIKSHSQIYFNKDKQSPSWCDRILIKTNRFYEILTYTALEDIQYSDHIPVQSTYSLYLTLPIISNICYMNPKSKSIIGALNYKNIKVRYTIAEADLDVIYPCSFALTTYYFINEKPCTAKTKSFVSEEEIPFTDKNRDTIELDFEPFSLKIPPKVIFDYPQMKAENIFFVIKMVNSKEEKEIGYAKYSFENTEKTSNILNHSEELAIHYTLRTMGVISFDAVYKYEE